MSPRTEIQYEQIRSEKRKLIMDIALEVFAEKTFQGASISMIAERAKISKGLLYNYFESKEALLKEIINLGVQDMWKFFDPNHDGVLTKEEFIFFIKKSFDVVKENINYWKLYTAIMFQPDVVELIKDDYNSIQDYYIKLSFELFGRCGINDPESELLLFSAMLKGAIIQYVAMPDVFPIDKLKIAIENYYINKLNSKL
jgi:AcrR family transcriptional regulator